MSVMAARESQSRERPGRKRVAKAAIASEMLHLADFGLRLINAGNANEQRDLLVSLIDAVLERLIQDGVVTRAAWDAGELGQASIDVLVDALDRHRLDPVTIDALLRDSRDSGAALYYFLAHCVLVATAIAPGRGIRRSACQQLWRRYMVARPAVPEAFASVSTAAPGWTAVNSCQSMGYSRA